MNCPLDIGVIPKKISLICQFEGQLNANIFQSYRNKIQSLVLKNLLEEHSETGDSIDKSLNEKCDKDLFFCMYCTAANSKTSFLFHVDVSFKRHKIES